MAVLMTAVPAGIISPLRIRGGRATGACNKMKGYLSTHVLDSAHGRPGCGIKVELYRVDADHQLLTTVTTNDDGRCDHPLLEGESFSAGSYELVFHVGAYYRELGVQLPEPAFLDQVVIRFGAADADQHYHVPLLISPYSYSTYRGS